MAQTNLKQSPNQSFNADDSNLRSLSQPTFIANNCLPPLSPFPPSESSLASSNSNLKYISKKDTDVSSQGSATSLPSPRENSFRGNSGLPPCRRHCRSNSDVPLGFSAMIQSSPQLVPISSQGILGQMSNMREKLENEIPVRLKKLEMETVVYGKNCGDEMADRKSEGDVVDNLFVSLMDLDHVVDLNSSGANGKDKDTIVNGMKISGGDSSNYDSESVLRHGASSGERGQQNTAVQHYRSLSMDSGIGNFHFGNSSLSGNRKNVSLDFGLGEFNEIELKRIKADERLAEIAISDPKRAKRILANRQSAARSKERKLRYISELEHKVQTLQTEATALSAQTTILQRDHTELTNQNNELKFRLQAMEQQGQLRDALHETLTAEVQRLKLANTELREEGGTNCIAQQVPMKHNMFPIQQQQPNQVQRLPVTSSILSTGSAAPTSA